MSLRTENLQAGDILLYNSDNLIARLIRKFDDAEVSHAGLYLGEGLVGEALIVGNPGLNRNPIAESVKGSNWVEVSRLEDGVEFSPVLAKADWYLSQGNRYAFEQIFMLAMILLTRKVDQGDWLVRQIAEKTLSGCAILLHRWRAEDREPMICSEFVFRAFDEALHDDKDRFTIEIGEQSTRQPIRKLSRRRRRRRFGVTTPTESPTIHPESLLAQIADEPVRMMDAPKVADVLTSTEGIEAEIERPGREYLGERASFRAEAAVESETSQEDVKAAAADFASALIQADRLLAGSVPMSGAHAMKSGEVNRIEELKEVVADFVTPGDLHRSRSLTIVGRLDVDRTQGASHAKSNRNREF